MMRCREEKGGEGFGLTSAAAAAVSLLLLLLLLLLLHPCLGCMLIPLPVRPCCRCSWVGRRGEMEGSKAVQRFLNGICCCIDRLRWAAEDLGPGIMAPAASLEGELQIPESLSALSSRDQEFFTPRGSACEALGHACCCDICAAAAAFCDVFAAAASAAAVVSLLLLLLLLRPNLGGDSPLLLGVQ